VTIRLLVATPVTVRSSKDSGNGEQGGKYPANASCDNACSLRCASGTHHRIGPCLLLSVCRYSVSVGFFFRHLSSLRLTAPTVTARDNMRMKLI